MLDPFALTSRAEDFSRSLGRCVTNFVMDYGIFSCQPCEFGYSPALGEHPKGATHP